MMAQSIMHTCIQEPKYTRKEMLTLVINIIQILKKYEKLKLIRKEKDIYSKNFLGVIKELNDLNLQLHESLPKIHEERPEIKKPSGSVISSKNERKIVPEKPITPEYGKLEEDIARLREKLSGI